MTTTTSTSSSSPGIELSAQPIWQERATTVSMTPMNQTHMIATYSGKGTLTLPNATEIIDFTTNGSTNVIRFGNDFDVIDEQDLGAMIDGMVDRLLDVLFA